MGLHRRYSEILMDAHFPLTLKGPDDKVYRKLSRAFDGMMRALFRQKGATFDVGIITSPQAQAFIEAHAGVLDSTFSRMKMSEAMRRGLERSTYIFSGMKAFHEMHEAFPSLIDENGDRKPFERFLNDVRSIDRTYNRNYLRAEYNFVHASSAMAARWETYEAGGDRYNLQYRTAGDGKVRPEHAALNGVTLPPSDSFWDSYYPPNGWNCRCSAVQVLKGKYPETPHDDAMQRGEQALVKDTKGIFRFNAGKQRKAIPDYNPYTIRRCNDCDLAKGKVKLARHFIPDNEVCDACKINRSCEDKQGYFTDKKYGERLLIHTQADQSEKKENIIAAHSLLGCFPRMGIKIRRHVISSTGIKNPEYEINSFIGDRKAILSEKGVSSAFKKGIKQGCEIIVLDLDARFKKLNINKLATHLNWRHSDFEQGIIRQCYVIFNGKAVMIDKTTIEKESIMQILRQIKQ